MVELKHLRTFREVALKGSFSDAAEALAFTQPAVSQHIGKLESALGGVRLLERDARGVRPTAAGEVLLRHAETVLEQVRRAEREVLDAAGVAKASLRVGAFPTVAAGLVPPAFKAMRDDDPRLELDLRVVEEGPALDELAAGRLDLVTLTESSLRPAAQRPGLRYEHVYEDQMLVALPSDHRLARQSAVSLADLAREAWFTPCLEGTCSDSNIVLRACREAGFDPDIRLTSDDYQAIQGMVASGMGVALIPGLAGGAARHDLVVRPVAGRPPTRSILAAVRDEEPADPLLDRLIEALRDAGRSVPLPGAVRLAA